LEGRKNGKKPKVNKLGTTTAYFNIKNYPPKVFLPNNGPMEPTTRFGLKIQRPELEKLG